MENVLLKGVMPPALEARLAAAFKLHKLRDEPDAKRFLAEHGARFSSLVTTAKFGAERALIESLPNLKVISSFGVGTENLDLNAARARGIAVGYTPNVLDDCVADLAFGLLLDVARGISASDRFVRRGGWLKAAYPLQTRVSGKRLGIVGLGRIGRVIAQRASGFEMQIRYHSRRVVDGVPWPHEPSLLELARWCDFLVVIVAGGPATRHLVSAAVLDTLGPEGFLINVARGSVIDEAALVDALVHKRIAGAGLDVFEREPEVPPALFELDNVVLLPHVASATHETRQAMADLVFDNLESYHRSGRLVAPVV
jgi:hydroxypyruvate reductase